MVLEDYGEMMFLQTVLKKIGFDVDAIQNARSFTEGLLRMNPDVLVMTAFGKKIHGLELCKHVTKTRGMPHILLLRSPGQGKEINEKVDLWLETPVAAPDLLKAFSQLCDLDNQMLQEKFQKLQMQETHVLDGGRVLKMPDQQEPALDRNGNEGNFAPGEQWDAESFGKGSAGNSNLNPSILSPQARRERYERFLKGKELPTREGFARGKVHDQVKALRDQEKSNDLEELERQRREFVAHLFRRK